MVAQAIEPGALLAKAVAALQVDPLDVGAAKAVVQVHAELHEPGSGPGRELLDGAALDGRLGLLVHQGSKEGVQPVVSPNTGKLFTVGSLGIGSFQRATLDISDVSNTAYSAVTTGQKSVWYRIDLATGRATRIGTVAGEALVGAAIEP